MDKLDLESRRAILVIVVGFIFLVGIRIVQSLAGFFFLLHSDIHDQWWWILYKFLEQIVVLTSPLLVGGVAGYMIKKNVWMYGILLAALHVLLRVFYPLLHASAAFLFLPGVVPITKVEFFQYLFMSVRPGIFTLFIYLVILTCAGGIIGKYYSRIKKTHSQFGGSN